ncbi:Alpha/beta hydrolase fold-containing protein [Desulfonema limicola]|uniref:Alpha/beta hydrolase fold-containing protein n=1 Tax=Desulfonema limicola TaxID=45656 RepID=A0A975BB07_9BACT|nr:alpha/beta hydrolase [Desulfonema limicola]QTA82041.1 Alpha/beta hydrolase fold-containing protein [Desulfonema limicola]
MPRIQVNGVEIFYEEHGKGPETIVFAHGMLLSSKMFSRQIEALKDRFRCIAFDFRGHGNSEKTASGYDMDTLTQDTAGLIKALELGTCNFAGLSMGGFVGMRLAARYPDLIKNLILMDTSADPESKENISKYRLLNFIARWFGLALVADRVITVMFGTRFLNDSTRAEEKALWRRHLISNNSGTITKAVKGVIDRQGIHEELDKIRSHTLIIVGDQDKATPPEKSRRIQEKIPGSELVIIPGAGHLSPIEEPEVVNAVLEEFFKIRHEVENPE